MWQSNQKNAKRHSAHVNLLLFNEIQLCSFGDNQMITPKLYPIFSANVGMYEIDSLNQRNNDQ